MRVAVVCPYAFDAHGGVQDQVGRIVAGLRATGHDAWAVAPGTGGPDGTRHVGGFVSWRANRSRAPIALSPAVVRRVGRAIDDAEVVHIHEPFMPLVSLAALLGDGPPRVGTFHADPGRVARRSYRIGRPIVRRLLERLAVVTAVSPVAASSLDTAEGVRIIPNGIDVASYRTTETKTAGRVVFVGRSDHRKGLDVLLAAWPGVVARHGAATLRVVGVGASDGLESVSFLGRLDERRKLAELAAAEVLVAPNRGGESFGIVVLEGMAAGCAIVASDLAAFRAVAADAARYVPVDDPVALATAINTLLDDPATLHLLAVTGSVRAAEFDLDAVLSGYMSAYQDALAGS